MIELNVEPYCQNCSEFEADWIIMGIPLVGGGCEELKTSIYCKRSDTCKDIEKHIRQYTDRQNGKWLHIAMGTYKCSVCNKIGRTKDDAMELGYNFCPNCGARMDGE